MRVDIRVLGGFEVTIDGRHVAPESWRRRHAAALVKLLVLAPGYRLHREQVIDALWPDLLVDDAGPRLHKATHFARSALGGPGAIVVSGDRFALFPDADIVVDGHLFEVEAERARSGDAALAGSAADRYRGDLLPDDLYEPWTDEPRQRWRLRHLELLRELGRWEALAAADPADEEAHLRLAHDHAQRGDRAAALRQLEWSQDALRRAFDVEPSPEARALREQVLAMPVEAGGGATATPRTAGVPLPATPTVGRNTDVAAVHKALDQSRLVTLLGPGGVGKTRLATEVVLSRAEGSAEVCFVDLTKVRDAALVPELIARDLGVHLAPSADGPAVLAEALQGRAMVLLLDNFEHVLGATVAVGELLSRAPEVRVLATSRARLQLAGERIVEVEPLAVDGEGALGPADAVVLFEQSASAIDPGFELAEHLEDVVAICRTVDGLPLAIELAAGHVRTLPPSLLRSRLAVRLGAPGAGARDAPARQQTIPDTIDWSLQLLGTAEQRLFARLGIFSSSASLDAVEDVCGESGVDVVGALSRLVDHCLVRRVTSPDGEPRFVLLELMRERARDLLADDERDEVAARHAAYVVRFLDDLDERRWDQASDRWIDLIDALLPEIRAAHGWATLRGEHATTDRITADMGTFWHREGHHGEGRRWVADALAHEDGMEPALEGRVRIAAGLVEWPRDELVARVHWARAMEIFRGLGHDRYLAYALALSAGTYLGEPARYEEGLALCDEGIALARAVGERPLIAQALNVRGELTRVRGDDAAALAAYEEGMELAIAAGDRAHLTVFLANLSYLADHRGEYEEARRLGCEALRMCRSLGRRMMAAWSTTELAGPELGLGRPERSAVLVGAGDAALRMLDASRHPGDRSEHERVLDVLHAVLDPGRFAELYALGWAMPLDAAIDFALSEAPVDELPTPQPSKPGAATRRMAE